LPPPVPPIVHGPAADLEHDAHDSARRSAAAGPVLAYLQQAQRRRRRIAWASAALLVVAAGAALWALDEERLVTLAQAGFARAARQDGLTSGFPALMPAQRQPDSQARPATPAPRFADNPVPAPAPNAASAAPLPSMAEPRPGGASAGEATSATTSSIGAATTGGAARTGTADAANTAGPLATSRSEQAAPAISTAGTEAATSLTMPTGVNRSALPVGAAPLQPSTDSSSSTNRNARTADTRDAIAGARPAAAAPPAPRISSPREACGDRTQFALYRCMQTQCDLARWTQHPQCKRFRERDDVD